MHRVGIDVTLERDVVAAHRRLERGIRVHEPRIERVVLLWNGVQRESLAGHVDTGHPLVLRPELEAR